MKAPLLVLCTITGIFALSVLAACSAQPPTSSQTASFVDAFSKLVPAIIALVVAIIGGFGIRQFQLNSAAELRLKTAAEAERDIGLSRLIMDLILQAGGNAGFVLSDKIIETVLNQDEAKEALARGRLSTKAIESVAFLPTPVSSASQRVAINAIVDLGIRYPALTDRARAGLEIIQPELFDTPLRADVDDGIKALEKIKAPPTREKVDVRLYFFLNGELHRGPDFTLYLRHTPAQLVSSKIDEPMGVPDSMRTNKPRFVYSARNAAFLDNDRPYSTADLRNGDVLTVTDEHDTNMITLIQSVIARGS